jgi:putative peptidoglycan lipid II flippase
MWKFINSKILNSQSQTITSAALILALASLVSRFLGLIRDRLLAGHFGAGDTLDIYYAAFRIPDLVYNLLIMGALSAGFIPVFVSLWQKNQNEKESWQFVNSILNILLLALLCLGVIFFIFTPFLMKLITPGFVGEKFNLTVSLTRIMFLSPLLLGVSAVWGGILQSIKKFLIFSLTPIFYNLGIIFGILVLVPRWGIFGLAWGVVLGALLHMVIQLPTLFSLGYKYQLVLNWQNQGLQRLARLVAPRTLTLTISQLNFLAITVLASGLAAGSLAIFNLSYNIWTFPLGILAASLATAAFPTLAQEASNKDWPVFAKTFSLAFRQILFLIIPSSALLIVLRAQIVRVILGTGKFGWTDTILTINSLQYLTVGLFAEALMLLLVRGFFALEDTKTPFWLGIVGSVFRISGAWFFSFFLGVGGLALGYAVGGIINMILLWFFLRQKVARLARQDTGESGRGSLNEKEIFISGLKIFVASLVAAASAYGMLRVMDFWVNTQKTLGIFSQGLVAGLVGLLVYFLAGLLLRSPEIQTFWQTIRNRLPFKTVAPDKELIQD